MRHRAGSRFPRCTRNSSVVFFASDSTRHRNRDGRGSPSWGTAPMGGCTLHGGWRAPASPHRAAPRGLCRAEWNLHGYRHRALLRHARLADRHSRLGRTRARAPWQVVTLIHLTSTHVTALRSARPVLRLFWALPDSRPLLLWGGAMGLLSAASLIVWNHDYYSVPIAHVRAAVEEGKRRGGAKRGAEQKERWPKRGVWGARDRGWGNGGRGWQFARVSNWQAGRDETATFPRPSPPWHVSSHWPSTILPSSPLPAMILCFRRLASAHPVPSRDATTPLAAVGARVAPA